mmetsp:Transcript_108224/g.345049  ORF Transcript_108224/g.345049 Transcript_108224/m.345049 type:complete len:294 (-) Transcript_108224:56-937(-)
MEPSLPVILLTRDEHAEGKWLTDLAAALRLRSAEVAVRALSGFRGTERGLLVNRVSDSAPAADVKRCLAALRGAELRGLPVLNGAQCYGVGTSKLLHYELFGSAGLQTPAYACVAASDDLPAVARRRQLRFPLLLKPNAAGFGKGILKLETEEELAQAAVVGGDGLALLQEYRAPDQGFTYRVWFLGARVQCAVRVTAPPSFNACVLNVTHEPWPCPPDVAAAVEGLAAAAGADCGSVELLYADGQPQYFDFNLLSTLPAAGEGGLAHYLELADHILAKPAGREGAPGARAAA